MDRVEIGQKIRTLREAKGLTQRRLAELAGQASSYIPEIERGLKCPTVEVLENICFALDITLAEFFAKSATQIKNNKLEHLTPGQRQLLNEFLDSL